MTEIKIRGAQVKDVSNIVRLLMDWPEAADLDWPEPREADVLVWVTQVITQGHIKLAERSGRLIGVLGLMPRNYKWNLDAWYFSDAFFYVHPSYRKGGVADALMKAAQSHCASHQLPLVMGIITGRNTERLERFYRITGGEYAGGTMVFGIGRKAQQEAAE